MEKWEVAILKAREAFELNTGYTPTHVVVCQEVWADLCVAEANGTLFDIWELDGMTVCVADKLDIPFELLIKASSFAV